MAASTATPIGTSRGLTSMNPTSTEHDFRFPRRPDATMADADSPDSKASAGDIRASLQDLSLNLANALASPAHDRILKPAALTFANMQNGLALAGPVSVPDLQEQDPLAVQVWKFFAKTKMTLPLQNRMENLTWRMMHVNLRKQKLEDEAKATSQPSHSSTNAPSGIAQLRKASEQSTGQGDDAMNIDDFIYPDNIATPAGLISTPSPEDSKLPDETSSHTVSSAIPIKSRKDAGQPLVPQSVPVPPAHRRSASEFDYVTRHHRKTSIDERRTTRKRPANFSPQVPALNTTQAANGLDPDAELNDYSLDNSTATSMTQQNNDTTNANPGVPFPN